MRLGFTPPRRVGLLGGSFNPAHDGHRHISFEALKRLRLDEVWWLVAPQNPLKPADGMAPFAKRIAGARVKAHSPRIKVLDLEARLGTRYTIDTVTAIRRLFPRTRFVWLMGADNLKQIRHWRRWRDIFRLLPVAVLDRPTYALGALSDLAAQAFGRYRVTPGAARRLADMTPPAWTFLTIKLDSHSASAIREKKTRAARKPAPPSPLLVAIQTALEDGQADDIRRIDLRGKSSIADDLLIASGRSARQVGALADRVMAALAGRGQKRVPVEGLQTGDWVLIDAGDVIVHLFRPEIRARYNLEKMWGAAFDGSE